MSKNSKKNDPSKSLISKIKNQITPSADTEEIRAMLAQAKIMQQKIHDSIEEIQAKTGVTFDDVDAYLKQSSNFSPEKWELIQKTKRDLEASLLKDHPEARDKIAANRAKAKPAASNKQKTPSKSGKSKTSAAKRKWIPMP